MATLKRRGYLQPSYEIYGGVAGFFDYGPLGAALKTNLENLWRRHYVLGEGMAEIQCPTISPEQVFRASGHLEKFADTVIECVQCGSGNRGDHLVRNEWKRLGESASDAIRKAHAGSLADALLQKIEEVRESADRNPSPENLTDLLHGNAVMFHEKVLYHGEHEGVHVQATHLTVRVAKGGKTLYEDVVKCPSCNKPLDIKTAHIHAFNLMFRTTVGPGSGRVGYLRPETAQGMFMDFGWLYRFFREKLPFGAVQVGKAYRNEISPRQSLLRLREFHQMEAEVFFDPEAKSWPAYERLAGKELNLLHRDATSPERMRMGDAVAKGIIANGALGYFIALTGEFLETAGIPADIIRFRQHGREEKAHYSTDTWDAEFLSPRFGWVEIVGIADRTDYDLKAHERVSGQKLRAMRRYAEPREVEVNRYVPNPTKLGPTFKGKAGAISEALRAMEAPEQAPAHLDITVDGETHRLSSDMYRVEKRLERAEGEWYVPHVVEPSYGIDRIFYAVLESAWESPAGKKEWTSLRLAPQVAPVKVGVFPLMAKDGLDTMAGEIDRELRMAGLAATYDDGGAIGRRYARQDEVGTPFCVTIDYQSKDDGTVTLRERDTGAQKRLPRAKLLETMQKLVAGSLTFEAIQAPVVG
ncbi:MAG: glycyl-tRNA synthetase [Thermoplasmata archaeon]|nr:glycyl-tRNA synthetase [Thermoplasmata archaeon]